MKLSFQQIRCWRVPESSGSICKMCRLTCLRIGVTHRTVVESGVRRLQAKHRGLGALEKSVEACKTEITGHSDVTRGCKASRRGPSRAVEFLNGNSNGNGCARFGMVQPDTNVIADVILRRRYSFTLARMSTSSEQDPRCLGSWMPTIEECLPCNEPARQFLALCILDFIHCTDWLHAAATVLTHLFMPSVLIQKM